jgi:hypothetical protein
MLLIYHASIAQSPARRFPDFGKNTPDFAQASRRFRNDCPSGSPFRAPATGARNVNHNAKMGKRARRFGFTLPL